VCAAVVVFALWRGATGPIVRQPLLLGYVVLAWLSIAWSVEPSISLRRSLFLLGSVVIGVYIGSRFRMRDQVRLVTSASAIGAAMSFIALLVWTDLAVSTGAMQGAWSGFYVNRNWLALALSLGLLSLVFWASTQLRSWPLILAVPMLALLAMTRSKTGILALAATFGITGWVWFLRKIGAKKHGALAGAIFVLSTVGSLGMLVHWYWTNILIALNRDPTMTRRTEIWQVVRWYARQHPWFGWGYEAIWANGDVIERSRLAVGKRAWAAHNGYYDIMLGLGRIGLVVFVLFLGIAAWRAFRHAWRRTDLLSFWPFSLIVFAVIVNFSESTFVAVETLFVLVVATTVATTEWPRREAT
jgi:O-antigen ligase